MTKAMISESCGIGVRSPLMAASRFYSHPTEIASQVQPSPPVAWCPRGSDAFSHSAVSAFRVACPTRAEHHARVLFYQAINF